ncbi:hypothetical protein FRC01_001106 [Tulasnella sp. 417]|nr:hypothetical protein FRC01_001106 [Tulasnella sp. 417]
MARTPSPPNLSYPRSKMGAGRGRRFESAWEEEKEGAGVLEPCDPGDNQESATANPFLTPSPSSYAKPLPNIPTPSENPSTWSLSSDRTVPTISSRNDSTHVPPQRSRKGSLGQITTIPSPSRNPSSASTIPGASRNHSTTQISTTTPRSTPSSAAQPPQPSYPRNYSTTIPPYNRHQSRGRSRVHVPQSIEEPELEESDEIDIDEGDDGFDGELDEEQLAETDVKEGALPKLVGRRGSKHILASRPGFIAPPVPILTFKPGLSREDKNKRLSGARKPSLEPVTEAQQRTQSRPHTPSRPESAQSPPPPPAPVYVQAQVHGASQPPKPYSSRHILSMEEFYQSLEAEKAAQLPPWSTQQQEKGSPKTQPATQQQGLHQVLLPPSPLNSDIVPAPVRSPSFAPTPLAPPKSKTHRLKPSQKTLVSSTGSLRSRQAAAKGERSRPIIVVDEEGRLLEEVNEDNNGQFPNTAASTVRRNRSQSNPVTQPHSSSTFGAPTSPVTTKSKTNPRIPIPQALLLECEPVVDIQNPRTQVASSSANIVRSGNPNPPLEPSVDSPSPFVDVQRPPHFSGISTVLPEQKSESQQREEHKKAPGGDEDGEGPGFSPTTSWFTTRSKNPEAQPGNIKSCDSGSTRYPWRPFGEEPSPRNAPQPNEPGWQSFRTIVADNQGMYKLDGDHNSTAQGSYADVKKREAWFEGTVRMQVAVKTLRLLNVSDPLRPKTSGASERCRKRLNKETKIWMTLNHPNIAPLLGYDDEKMFCMISPWFENGNINEYVHRTNPTAQERLVLV